MSRNANGNINHLPCKHDPININEIHVFFRVLQKILYRENSKMRFPWYRDNGKNRDTPDSNPGVHFM